MKSTHLVIVLLVILLGGIVFYYQTTNTKHKPTESEMSDEVEEQTEVETTSQPDETTQPSEAAETTNEVQDETNPFIVGFGQTSTLKYSGSGFFDGEFLLIVDISVYNAGSETAIFSSNDFRARDANGTVHQPVRLSSIGQQPRVISGITGLPTGSQELREIEVAPGEVVQGGIVFYVSNKDADRFWIVYEDQVAVLDI